ncbi:MAG: UbiD family decarboxylase [Dehalococcoidales bacterium]|nr:UbiD family decarboxylase [Dehalococcoidales bacterium]
MGYYNDLREYIQVLEENNKLVRVKEEINKDTELMPLVSLQFRGLSDADRKAFLFENIIDVKGRKYSTPVLVASHAGSREIYALAMKCKVEEIADRWRRAQVSPIKPRVIGSGVVQEEQHIGDKLLEHGGLGEFPVPIATPGFDNAPYFTAGNCVSKDPDTGIGNVGNYRIMIKSPDRAGFNAYGLRHLGMHWEKYKQRGIPMPVAVVVGPTPNLGLVAVTKVPYGVDEYDVAGGIAGEPLSLVKCKTVDLEVPAAAEIVIEGTVPTDYLEREGPFAEHTGYIGMDGPNLVFNITAITHRKGAVWNAFISAFPPSESSLMRGLATESTFLKHLKEDLGLDAVTDVAFHRESGSYQFCVIRMKRTHPAQVWRAMYGAFSLDTALAKIIIAVDDDIDPRDLDSVVWALCYRMQPHCDIRSVEGKTAALDPSGVPPEERGKYAGRPPTSSLLINATRKWDYPPTALPKKEFMERAMKIWEERLGLPRLNLKSPWYGQSLGYWPEYLEREAELALEGEHYQTGENMAKNRTQV